MVQYEVMFTALTQHIPPAPLHTLQRDHDFALSLKDTQTLTDNNGKI